MNNVFIKFKLYLKPLIICTGINLFLFFNIGTFFESYDGLFSSFIQGTYTKQCTVNWNENPHFLLMIIYEYINIEFPHVQVYGIALFLYNWISLTFLGLVFYRLLKINIGNKNMLLFILLYSVISIDSMINLSSSRIVFISMSAIFLYIESCRIEGIDFGKIRWYFITFIIFFVSLIRNEAVILSAICYLMLLIYHKRIYKLAFLPLMIASGIFLAYNYSSVHYMSEAKQVFVYKEKEVIDRNNINYNNLTKTQELELMALMKYGITDSIHYTLDFYTSISNSKTKNGLKTYFNGLKPESILNALRNSYGGFFTARYYLIFYILSVLLLLFNFRIIKSGFLWQTLIIAIFPVIVCINTMVPASFLSPYYVIFGCLNLLILVAFKEKNNLVSLFAFCMVLLFSYNTLSLKRNYLQADKLFKINSQKLKLLSNEDRFNKPIIINKIDIYKFYPVNPLDRLPQQNVVFLNAWLTGAWDFYIQAWGEICNCNPLSLKAKTDYMVGTQNLFITDDISFNFMNTYFESKYHVRLIKTDIGVFDNELKISKIEYLQHNN
jgi:hypothetical protein